MRREHDSVDPSNEDLFQFFDINKDHYISMNEFAQQLKMPKKRIERDLNIPCRFCFKVHPCFPPMHFLSRRIQLDPSFLSVRSSINEDKNISHTHTHIYIYIYTQAA